MAKYKQDQLGFSAKLNPLELKQTLPKLNSLAKSMLVGLFEKG